MIDSRVIKGDSLDVLQSLPSASIDLVYIDPPFNTGKVQKRSYYRTKRSEDGTRKGFQGKTYSVETIAEGAFVDSFDNYLEFLRPRIEHTRRVLKPSGSFYFHVDYREVHYCKVLIDQIFGRDQFLNEIIWAYDYGARTTKRWPAKHDNILFYARDRAHYFFDIEEVDRIPYMAPGLVGESKAKKGKLPTDTWWHTIVSPTGKEKLGYPTQKPLGIVRRIVRTSCPPGGIVLDYFAGSGTTGQAALESGRHCILVDSSATAIDVMKRRFADSANLRFESFQPSESLETGLDSFGTLR